MWWPCRHSRGGFPTSQNVISFTDLPDELLPEELRAFSDPLRRQQTFLSCLGKREKAPIVQTIFDLYEREVKKFMLDIREETLRNVLSVVDPKRIIAALGDEMVIAALGEEKVISALGDDKIIAALLKNKPLLQLLLAKLDTEQLRKTLEEKSHN